MNRKQNSEQRKLITPAIASPLRKFLDGVRGWSVRDREKDTQIDGQDTINNIILSPFRHHKLNFDEYITDEQESL